MTTPDPALQVLSLEQAKLHLNIPLASTVNDDELAGFVPAAVERVERHLGRSLTAAAAVSASELLACKVVLGEYWRTQRARGARGGGQITAATAESDSGPAGLASLTARLTELLGPRASSTSGGRGAPRGSFPPPRPWPDPAELRGHGQ